MANYTSAEVFAIIIEVAIALLVVRRSYAMSKGVPVSNVRMVVLPAVLLVLWGLDELESPLLTPLALPYLVALDVGILIATAWAVSPVAERMTQVTRDPSGALSYRIGFSLAALFVGAFVLRLAIAVILFPSSLEFGAPQGGFPPIGQQWVLAVIDAMFSFSAGLILARSIGIRRKLHAAKAGPPSDAAA